MINGNVGPVVVGIALLGTVLIEIIGTVIGQIIDAAYVFDNILLKPAIKIIAPNGSFLIVEILIEV